MQRVLHRLTGGAIHYTVHAERTATGEANVARGRFDMTADLTFSPDARATLTLDGSHSYTVDTTSGQVSRTGS
jgi:hypothetical protein